MIKRLIKRLRGKVVEEPREDTQKEQDNAILRGKLRERVKQVFAGKEVDPPDFVADLDASLIPDRCGDNAACEYQPHFERKRIYTAKRTFEGDLEIEYEGIAVSCGAIKHFGLTVAKHDGLVQAYRYADLNHIYRCCCGTPSACPFYQLAKHERKQTEGQMRGLPGTAT